MSEMGSNKEDIEQGGGKSTASDNKDPVVVGKEEVEKQAPDGEKKDNSKGEKLTPDGKEKELNDDSEKMEVDNEEDEILTHSNQKGNEIVETNLQKDQGKDAANGVRDVANDKGCDKLVPENQADLGRAEEKGSKPEDTSIGMRGMKVSLQDGAPNEQSSNGLNHKQSFSKNGAKEEDLKTEVKMMKVEESTRGVTGRSAIRNETKRDLAIHVKDSLPKAELDRSCEADVRTPAKSFLYDYADGYESGTEEEQAAFLQELEVFHRERGLDFKPPKFYQEQLNLLKLWRWVIKLGGYEQVTSCKIWRQVGESFKPPKTCTTVSWTFRGFYEKTLLEFEKHKILSGELPEIDASFTEMSAGTQAGICQTAGPGRARRDAAARAMQGWHSLRVSSNGEVGDPIIKEKNPISLAKREKQLKSIGLLKRQKQSSIEHVTKVGHLKSPKPQSENMVVDIGPPADWVKINVQKTKDCFEVYALVPGLLREEVRVQSDPAGRLVISGQPEHLDNPWGVTPFKKIVSLPSRIDPHQTSAVVTLHGQLFIRVPFEQSDS